MDIVRRLGARDPEALALVRGTGTTAGAAEAVVEDGGEMLLVVTRRGYGKRVRVDAFPPKGRGGSGMIAIKFKNDSDELVALSQARADDQVSFLALILCIRFFPLALTLPPPPVASRKSSPKSLIPSKSGQNSPQLEKVFRE
jgi:hypothetical protein